MYGSLAVIIASRGRPTVLSDTVASLHRQSYAIDQLIIVVARESDAERLQLLKHDAILVVGPDGLTKQRNAGIRQLASHIDWVMFVDDDVELHCDYLLEACEFLHRNPSVAALSGFLLADGNLSREQAHNLILNYQESSPLGMRSFRNHGPLHMLYGCNMVIRRPLLDYECFDENLPRYGYAEDYDLSVRLMNYGHVGRFSRCIAVHLQHSDGRIPGKLMGYSMIANNWYFLRKGVTHLPFPMNYIRFVLVIVLKRILLNSMGWIFRNNDRDARGQLLGNLIAVRDIMMGKSSPSRILDF
jgi:GT2 family glycosyltransferase